MILKEFMISELINSKPLRTMKIDQIIRHQKTNLVGFVIKILIPLICYLSVFQRSFQRKKNVISFSLIISMAIGPQFQHIGSQSSVVRLRFSRCNPHLRVNTIYELILQPLYSVRGLAEIPYSYLLLGFTIKTSLIGHTEAAH